MSLVVVGTRRSPGAPRPHGGVVSLRSRHVTRSRARAGRTSRCAQFLPSRVRPRTTVSHRHLESLKRVSTRLDRDAVVEATPVEQRVGRREREAANRDRRPAVVRDERAELAALERAAEDELGPVDAGVARALRGGGGVGGVGGVARRGGDAVSVALTRPRCARRRARRALCGRSRRVRRCSLAL